MSSCKQRHFLLGLSLVLLALLPSLAPRTAHGQSDPDLRNIEPLMMIIVDTSGSMERKPGCVCTTTGCTECLPNCPISDTPPANDLPTKNRWAYTMEALTGTFSEFRCRAVERSSTNGATYDLGYFMDYHQPWHCPTGVVCPPPSTIVKDVSGTPTTVPLQNDDGVLDRFAGQFRFGLMTFDGIDTYRGANPLIHQSSFSTTLSNSIDGMWSYAGPKPIHYPNCTEDYLIDTGARSSIATEGALISVNSTVCGSASCDIYQINSAIQSSLIRSRPYGGTPTAAVLDDLYYHLKNELTDTFGGCRNRYALLITDGPPDDDYRSYGCDCARQMNCPVGEDPSLMKCPYPLPEEVAKDLVTGRAGDPPQLQQLSVLGIGINTADTALRAKLNLIASEGGSLPIAPSTDAAVFVDDSAASLQTLSSALEKILGGSAQPISRSVPAFATGTAGMYQVSTGFEKALGPLQNGIAPPWTGVIERRRIACGADLIPTEVPYVKGSQDDFSVWLNGSTGAEANRRLWTALPSTGGPTFTGHLTRAISGAPCGTGANAYCGEVQLNTLAPEQLFGTARATDTAQRDNVIGWMYGRAGTVRASKRLGDIYHSSPAIPRPPPPPDGTDESYAAFLTEPAVGKRPLVMYVGTNDGILHAFSVEDYNGATAGNTAHSTAVLTAGQELWGFVPPLKLPALEAQLYGHQFSMDGVPVVKDVLFKRSSPPSADDFRSVLITGMRRGGNAYVALDVSDPLSPKFLWQFTRPEMGYTYGKPVIIQADFLWDDGSGGTPTREKRAVAVLPGGSGLKGAAIDCNNSVTTPAFRDLTTQTPYASFTDTALSGSIYHRADVRCWKGKDPNDPLVHVNGNGRALYFVDVVTGKLIKEIRLEGTGASAKYVFPSPITGSPTMYPDTVGSIAKEGFVVDADGVIWRIDISAVDPGPNDDPRNGWTVRPFHDMFFGSDGLPTDGEVTYETPILTIDDQKRLVVLVGTGDTDNFDKPDVKNRIVSVTQVQTTTGTGADKYKAAVNWEHRVKPGATGLVQSELVTGTMALFEGRLFYATFISVVSGANACDLGRGRLWSVHYKDRDDTDANANGTYGPKHIDLTSAELAGNSSNSGATIVNVDVASAADNLMVFGLGATQPSCKTVDTFGDTYFAPSMPRFVQGAPPSIWLVAQTSRGGQATSTQLGNLRMKLLRGESFSKISSWAGSID